MTTTHTHPRAWLLLVVYSLIARTARGEIQPLRGSCDAGNATSDMPRGTFAKTCFNCSIDYHVMLCRCARQSVGPPEELTGGANLTGEWFSRRNGAPPIPGIHQDTIVLEYNSTAAVQGYSAVCADNGFYNLCSARPTSKPVYGPRAWHAAIINTTDERPALFLDNGTSYFGTLALDNDTLTWTWHNTSNTTASPTAGVPPPAAPPPLIWQRRPPALTGVRTSVSLKSCDKVAGWPNAAVRVNMSNEDGYLTCDWSDAPPPRVGQFVYSLTSNSQSHQVSKNCRLLLEYTFLAPQMKARGDPVGSVFLGGFASQRDQQRNCCDECHNSRRNGGPTCRAWTLVDAGTPKAVCNFISSPRTAYPHSELGSVSGYTVQSDPATLCQAKFQSNNGFWADRLMARGTDCLQMLPHNGTDFPAWWWDGKRDRGTSWLFFPIPDTDKPQCECVVTAPQTTQCRGPNITQQNITHLIAGKPWIVFTHGGFFQFYDGKDANYAETNSKVAAAANMGILALDYRELAGEPVPFTWQQQLDDIVASLTWLHQNGATQLYLYGDSSGGSLTVQTLLYMAKKRLKAKAAGEPDPFKGVNITAAGTFSGWFDMSDSFPQYDSRQYCGGKCTDISSSVFASGPGNNRIGSACQSRRFADYESAIPLNDAIISPIDAPSELLAELPPLMLIVGGGETLLGENIAFAQRCHLAGTPAMVQVYTGMWHDFIQESEGCHNTMSTFGHGKPLEEAVTAIQRMGNFFRYNQSCRVVCESDTEFCSGAAPVKWNFNYHELPPPTSRDCQ
eukprot:m.114226 g.114226  ORF g.114226 m.114226 type:complete len:787 (+) comp21505_c0_seq10:477-2837(+)